MLARVKTRLEISFDLGEKWMRNMYPYLSEKLKAHHGKHLAIQPADHKMYWVPALGESLAKEFFVVDEHSRYVAVDDN